MVKATIESTCEETYRYEYIIVIHGGSRLKVKCPFCKEKHDHGEKYVGLNYPEKRYNAPCGGGGYYIVAEDD